MGDRVFAGYTFRERLLSGFFGDVFRGIESTGKEARILELCPAVAGEAGLVAALVRYAADLSGFEHHNVVSTIAIGHTPDRSLVVLSQAINDAISLRDLLISAPGGKLPVGVAMAIADGLLRGLAHTHRQGLIHGGLHPRSVVIDKYALIKLHDFAIARAVLELAVDFGDLHDTYRGYLAPEIFAGELPSAATDVYAVGAIMYTMLAGAPIEDGKPGRLAATTSIRRLVMRAVDPDPGRRFGDGVALHAAFDAAVDGDECPIAMPSDLFDYVEEARNVKDIFVAAETPLGKLMGSSAAAVRNGGLDDALAAASDSLMSVLGGNIADAPTDDDEEVGGDSQLTQVDDLLDDVDPIDPIADLIELERTPMPARGATRDDATPLPPPLAEHEIPGSVTRDPHLFVDSEIRSVVARAADAVDELEAEEDAQRAASVIVDSSLVLGRAKTPTWVWALATATVLVGLLLLVYTQTDVFHPERARAKREAAERKHKEAERRLRAEQKQAGNIMVEANEDGAAVWLLLGRTPVDSMLLPTAQPHQLRFEREGYVGEDMIVKASHWTGDRASIRRSLTGGQGSLPAWPPPIPEAAKQGFEAGKQLGLIHLESTPPGAQVWLLVGYTPEVRLTDFEAGVAYEFKILKDGRRPGVAVIHAADWQLDPVGNPSLLRSTLVKMVELQPL